MEKFYSNGKLLLTGEYVVLDGALSLALPTKYGQSLIVETIDAQKIIWKSFNDENLVWFETEFDIKDNSILKSTKTDKNIEKTERLLQILNAAKTLNSKFLNTNQGYKITTHLNFPNNWGLGTSSTLINNIAQWSKTDAYLLLKHTFKGSGYDIACAKHNYPITYQIKNNTPLIKEIRFNPIFKEHLYFVHLNKKQNSRDGIKHYHDNKENAITVINAIEVITKKLITCHNFETFENLINEHESLISKITKQVPVKALLFQDFKGSIKSLGAWGGDFILASSKTNPTTYFNKKGFHTIQPYKDIIL